MAHRPAYALKVPAISLAEVIDQTPSLQRHSKRRKTASGHAHYDFASSASQYDLNQAIVRQFFDIDGYTLSRSNLCPTVTGRLEYLRLVEKHLAEPVEVVNEMVHQVIPSERWVLDIGTGSSVVYPVIGTSLNSTTKFIATEVDPPAVAWARRTIGASPRLSSRVTLVEVASPNDDLIPVETVERMVEKGHSVRYTVCNPPFYADAGELEEREAAKAEAKPNQLQASSSELFCAGGEEAFIRRLVDQSLELGDHPCFRDTWYTSLVGIRVHVQHIQQYWAARGITDTWVHSFGARTKRWIVAWRVPAAETRPRVSVPPRPSLGGAAPSDIARGPHPASPEHPCRSSSRLTSHILARLGNLSQKHPFGYQVVEADQPYIVTAEPVWYRRYRRHPTPRTPLVIRVEAANPVVLHMAYDETSENSQAIMSSLSQILT